MKSFIVFAAIMAVGLAAPQIWDQGQYGLKHPVQQQLQTVPAEDEQKVTLVKETLSDNIGVGGYNYAYELSDGQARRESAELINEGTENAALRITGSYSWVDADDNVYTVNYVADENGFHPQGAHLPSF